MIVPLFKQKKHTCGPTCIKMALAYYGVKTTEKEILGFVGGIKNFGVRAIKLADFAKSKGFETECFSYNKKLSKGKAKIKNPEMKDIVYFVKRKIPVILNVHSSVLYKKETKAGHFIVVTDYRNKHFFYNDPLDGKNHEIEEENLMFAWLSEVMDSSAYLVAILPKA